MRSKSTAFIFRVIGLSSSIGALASIVGIYFFQSLSGAIDIPTFHLDGAFQTASGLFRLDEGQAPGRDFYPYLGIGPLLLIFPFFKLAGATLSASVFAAQFVTVLVGCLTLSVLWHLVLRPRTILFSFVGGSTIFFLAGLVATYLSTENPFAFATEPGNSLRPLRSSIPYIVSILTFFLFHNLRNKTARDVLAGLLIGITLQWSNDFAFPTGGLFIAFYFFAFFFFERSNWKKSVFTFFTAFLFSWVILITAATLGHPIDLIKYNFVDVATDQWWYFGSYSPDYRILELSHLRKLVFSGHHIYVFAAPLLIVFAFWTKRMGDALVAQIGLILFSGGCVASIGGHLDGYFAAFKYWGSATVAIYSLKAAQVILEKAFELFRIRYSGFGLLLLISYFCVNAYYFTQNYIDYNQKISLAKNDDKRFFDEELGGYLEIEWKDYVEYARAHRQDNTIEEYWGIWSAINRTFSQWPVDSVIHALGNVRETAKDTLASADLIISTRYTTSPTWQPWNISQNFWFYDDLFLNWKPDVVSPTTVVWKRTDQPRENTEVTCRVLEDGTSIMLPSDEIAYYKVTLDYSTTGSGRHILLLRNNISFAAHADGYVSIPLGSNSIDVLMLVTDQSGAPFEVKVIGSQDVRFKFSACSAEKIEFSHDEVMHRP